MSSAPKAAAFFAGKSLDHLEEGLISLFLALMTVLTFANVVARYVFNANILWALQMTVFLFAWMVLLGASYMVKKNLHIGVDIITSILPPSVRRFVALIAVSLCILFSFLLLKGAWDYWANFANLPKTTGRWFPTGFEEKFRPKGFYEVNDVPMPAILAWMADVFNEGERYEKIPRLMPYFILPLSMALLLYRFIEVAIAVWAGRIDSIIKAHEAEDTLAPEKDAQGAAPYPAKAQASQQAPQKDTQ